mgnify:CR=1 FL=1
MVAAAIEAVAIAEAEAAIEAVECCGRLPLALPIAGRLICELPRWEERIVPLLKEELKELYRKLGGCALPEDKKKGAGGSGGADDDKKGGDAGGDDEEYGAGQEEEEGPTPAPRCAAAGSSSSPGRLHPQ